MSKVVELKVSGRTDPNKLGGAIVKTFDEGVEAITVKAMGAEAVNQMQKGIIVANQYLSPRAKRLDILPGFDIKEELGKEVTLIFSRLTIRNA